VAFFFFHLDQFIGKNYLCVSFILSNPITSTRKKEKGMDLKE